MYRCGNKIAMLSVAFLSSLLSGCSVPSMFKRADGPPMVDLSWRTPKDAVPRKEAKSRGGNRPSYHVRGKEYYVLPSAQGYTRIGKASWYGKRFHGHKTSNGEVYNMYQMTAANRELPLPTFLRVTNLQNHKQVVVRVNDRGPFHKDRILDLSYAAAKKLGMMKTGTANVRIEAITPGQPKINPQYHNVQVATFDSYERALELKERLAHALKTPAHMQPNHNKYQVFLSSVTTSKLPRIKNYLAKLGIRDAIVH